MHCRGVRGATTVSADTRDEVLAATRQLLALMIRLNDIRPEDVGSAIFSTTEDVNAEFPALAARQLGWNDVPLLCTHELNVPGSLPLCIRVLVMWNTPRSQADIRHVYIKGAVRLRPDLSQLPPVDFQELEAWINDQMLNFRKP
jgi:chorismate mutase